MKSCSKCKEVKSFDDFYNSKNTKSGKRSECKICCNKDNRSRDYTEHIKQYRLTNKEELNRRKRERHSLDNTKKKEYFEKNKEIILKKNSDYHKVWYEKNREKKLLQNKIYNEKRESIDPEYKLRKRLRSRLTTALKNYVKVPFKERNVHLLIGCTLEELKIRLESMFTDDMTWNNHGKIWHIDHIKPCILFDLSKIEEQRLCFHFTNLQPLYALENLQKHTKYG